LKIIASPLAERAQKRALKWNVRASCRFEKL
jgi:hypothetical protein